MITSGLTAADIARLRNASEWLQRLNEPNGNAQALGDEWSQWCRSDPLNLPVFEQMRRIWDAFSEVRGAVYAAPQPAKRFKPRA